MKYGHFDLKNKEYVITRPDTPAPWVNYLGSPEYGAIISNNAADRRSRMLLLFSYFSPVIRFANGYVFCCKPPSGYML